MGEAKNEFEELERDLRDGLTVRAAPDGFAKNVLARIETRKKAAPVRMPMWRWAAAAAIILGLFAGGRWEQQREQRIAGEQARDQVILALRITGSTLEAVQQKIQQTGKEVQP